MNVRHQAVYRWFILATLLLLIFASTQSHSSAVAQSPTIQINELLAANARGLVDPDFHALSDWIELYNGGTVPHDISGYFLTDDLDRPQRWRIPDGTVIQPRSHLLIWADGQDTGYHTNFVLNKGGETVGLFNPSGFPIDSVTFTKQITDIAWGRVGDGAMRWAYYADPTPGAANINAAVAAKKTALPPQFSRPGGFYDKAQWLTFAAMPDAVIRVTFDGSTPTNQSAQFVAPLHLTTNTVIKARSFISGYLPSVTITHAYFIGERPSLPVISLSTAPRHLWDDTQGIYVEREIELRKDWERPVTVTWFEAAGERGFQVDAAMRLYGNSAFLFPQKSLSILAKDKFGQGSIDYRLFPTNLSTSTPTSFKSLVLRSSSDDWKSTLMRDAMLQTLLEGQVDVDLQAYRPALLFINGDYFGIHNVREKLNEHYIATHHGVDPTNVDLVKQDLRRDLMEATVGDLAHFNALMDFVRTHDLRAARHYVQLQRWMDMPGFIDYIAVQVYIGNRSWHHNRRLWRTRDDDGHWRLMFFDLDRGFDTLEHDTLGAILEQDELFRQLWQNKRFQADFARRLTQLMDGTFAPPRAINTIDQITATLAPEMPRHIARWKDKCWYAICGIQSMSAWRADVQHLRRFAIERPAIVRQQMAKYVQYEVYLPIIVR